MKIIVETFQNIFNIVNENNTYKKTFIIAFILRLILFIYGCWQDANFAFKYTDIDYYVYTDAAKHVANGETPFKRATYRYTPVLAYILWPTHIPTFFSFGKILFIFADLAVGYFIYEILILRGLSTKKTLKFVAFGWLFSPISFTISTRGNADPLVGLLCLLTIYLLMKKQVVLSALVYGFAVHFKIYPIVYVPSILIFLDRTTYRGIPKSTWKFPISFIANRDRIVFGAISGGLFLSLIGIFYHIYGYEFLYETYLYHFVRKDNRHNFSMYFYDLYLSYDNNGSGSGGNGSLNTGLLAFLPQIILWISIGIKYGEDLPFAFFLATYVFVAWCKVCTAQYFLWYCCLLPIILPTTNIKFKWKGFQLILFWFCGEVHWLLWAKGLELDGESVFLQLWIASVIFFTINVWIIGELLKGYTSNPLFKNGILIQSIQSSSDNNNDKLKKMN